jgi:hypothetical protein
MVDHGPGKIGIPNDQQTWSNFPSGLRLTLERENLSWYDKAVLAGLASVRKSETQVFPTFLFAGHGANDAQLSV